MLTAANVYLGLKIGITVATSIPAAVISMAVLKPSATLTIQENNIVQTIASAAGTLSAIVFVLPGLIMVGWWTGFPYWLSVAVIAIGGILGVMYSVPLRRALVTGTDLPYPGGRRGRRGAEGRHRRRRRRGKPARPDADRLELDRLRRFRRHGPDPGCSSPRRQGVQGRCGATAASASLSMPLIGVGHLVGLTVGIAMFVGLLISWALLVPHYTALRRSLPARAGRLRQPVFRNKVRFIGAGTIGVAAIWTRSDHRPDHLGASRAMAPTARASRPGGDLPLTERDIPIGIVGASILVSMIPIGLLLYAFGDTDPIAATPDARSPEHPLHPGRGRRDRRGHRLHGRPHRRVEQPDLRRRHPVGPRHFADPRRYLPGRYDEATKALVAFALFVTAIVSSASRRSPTTTFRI